MIIHQPVFTCEPNHTTVNPANADCPFLRKSIESMY